MQESLTDQHRLAYNSLVEKPSTGAVFKQQLNDMEKSYRNGETARQQTAAMHTLPRASPGPPGAGRSTADGPNKPPNLNISESARNGHISQHQRAKESKEENIAEGVCESPSYVSSASTYSYNAMDGGGGGGGLLASSTPLPSANLVPLPPRDRFKPQTLPSQKRHVRKHALIIPATGTLRTLDKLGSNHLSEENRLRLKTVADKSKMDLHSDTNLNCNSDSKIKFSALHKLQVVESAPQSPAHFLIYQNFSMIPAVAMVAMPNAADTASLNFETIVERKDLNHVPDLFSLRDCSGVGGGGGGGHILERSASLVAASDGGDRVDGVVSETPIDEGVDGVVVVTTTGAAENESSAVLSNSVSCEDLLEFSEKKPNGRERGAESDEVRIMIKVLGPKVRTEADGGPFDRFVTYHLSRRRRRLLFADESRVLFRGAGHYEVGGRAQGHQDNQAAQPDGGGQAGRLVAGSAAAVRGTLGEQRVESAGHGNQFVKDSLSLCSILQCRQTRVSASLSHTQSMLCLIIYAVESKEGRKEGSFVSINFIYLLV